MALGSDRSERIDSGIRRRLVDVGLRVRPHLQWSALLLPWTWYVLRDLHPVMELVAITLPVLCIAAALTTALLGALRSSPLFVGLTISLIVFGLIATVGPWRPERDPAPSTTVRVASMNLGQYWFSDNDAAFFVEENVPDILVGAELTESHHEAFSARFEHSVSDIMSLEQMQANEKSLSSEGDDYRRFGLPSIGVYAGFPLTQLEDPIADRIPGGLPGFRVRIDAPDQPMILYALHIPRSVPVGSDVYRQSLGELSDMVDAIDESIRAEDLPVVVLGDLNLSDRGSGYRTLTASLKDGMRASGWALPTADRPLPWSLLFLRIDHLLVSSELCTTNASATDTRYSDHRPLLADVGPCPDTDGR